MAFGNATKGYVKKHGGGGGGGGSHNNFTVDELTNGNFKLSDYKLLLVEGKNQYGIIGTGLFFTANMNTTDRYNFSVTEKTNNFTFRISVDSNNLITIIKSAGDGDLSHIYGIK